MIKAWMTKPSQIGNGANGANRYATAGG
jgi:hypothetical protein